MNGANSRIVTVVNTDTLLPNNAFFIPPPFGPNGLGGFFYGATSSGTPLTPLDIVAHEYMHGVTFATVARRTGSGLGDTFYLSTGPSGCGFPFWCSGGRYVVAGNHPGALNEGICDVFGTAVEFDVQPQGSGTLRADYTSGEDLLDSRFGRSLSDPATFRAVGSLGYPDHVQTVLTFPVILTSRGPFSCSGVPCDLYPAALRNGRFEVFANYVAGQGVAQTDGGGVHMNSTLISHAYYLAIEGGRNRTSGRPVTGVGQGNRQQVERVFFVAVRDYLPRAASFAEMAAALRTASRVTYGTAAAVTRAIDEALLAVGL